MMCCPGGTRLAAGVSRRVPTNPREMNRSAIRCLLLSTGVCRSHIGRSGVGERSQAASITLKCKGDTPVTPGGETETQTRHSQSSRFELWLYLHGNRKCG